MEIKEFQAKLSEALGLAVENGKKIHADTVEGIFAGNGLTEGQMQKVYEYLAIQGIQVDGRGPGSAAADGQTGSEAPVTTAGRYPGRQRSSTSHPGGNRVSGRIREHAEGYSSRKAGRRETFLKGSETGRSSAKKLPGRIIP